MSEFNVDEYFANRSKAFKTPDGSDFINDKYLELQRTSQDKVRELTERSSLAAQQEAADQESWVGKQGLDSKGFQGKAVNDAANLYQGTMRVAGSVLSAAPSALAAANQANLSEDDIVALERHQKGQSTPEDLARINRKVAPIVAPTPGMPRELAQAHANERAQAMADLNPNAPTPLSIWGEMNKSREVSRTIVEAADKSSVVHKGAQTAFGNDLTSTYNDSSSQIAKGWEDLKAGNKLGGSSDIAVGVAKLLFGGISDVASNPQATFEYMVQNAPQLLIGLAGKAGATTQLVDNVSSAADLYNKGIQDYQAKNGGALPPEDQRQYMAFMAATHAAAEQVGDKIGLAATKLGGEVAKDISKASFKAALKGTATAVGEGVLSEAPTEAYQQFAEGEIAGKPATGAKIFSAGVIGGASGAGLSGGGRAVHEAAKLAAQPSPAKQETIDQAKVQEAAIASGDVSKITDPVNQIAALFGHSQQADTTQEQKQTNLAKASEIVAGLEAEQAKAEQAIKTSTVAGVEALIAERQAQLADPEINNDAGNVTALNGMIELAQADLAELMKSKDRKAIEQKTQKWLDTTNTQLREAKTAKDNLAVLVQSKDTIDADIALIGAPQEANDALAAGVAPRATPAVGVSKEQTAAADRIITLAMTAPERLDTKVVAALAADTNNALTVPQRAYLSAFLRAQQSNPTLTSSHVAKDIYKGEYGNKGVLQFRAAMGKALAAGNQKMADAELTGKFGIFNFVQAHQNKADVAAQAIELGIGTSILKENGQWVVGAPGVEVTPEQHKAGGRTITSERLALAIKEEAQALSDVAAELQAAYDLKFSAPVKVVDKAKPAPVVVASTEKAAEVTATQAEYDEAVRVSKSTNETDYDNVPGNIASLITAMNDGTEIKISPVEKTASTEEPSGSSVNNEVTQSTESTKEEGKSTAEVTQPTGTLEALVTKSPEGTPFNERGLLADNFKQSAGKALVDVKNFLSTLVATASEQHPAVQSFIKHAQAWNKTITLNLPKVGERRFRYEDMMRFLITDTDGVSDIEENVKTAISYAVYQYVASEATSPQYHKDSAINSILGRQKDEWVSPSARETLAHVGMGQDRLIDSLGGTIMDVLGFKANDDAGQELASKLRAALGAHALKLMEDLKLVQGYVVSGPDMQNLREEGLDANGLRRLSKARGSANTKVAVTFFAIARNTEAGNDTAGKVTARVERIYQDTRGSQDALGKLFKAEPSTKIPSLVPVTDVAKVTAGTNQGVPDEQRDALEVMQSREHFVREDSLDFLGEFSEEDQLTMMGVVEEENATVHRANRISVKAKNDGLRREWANFHEYVGEYLATAEKKLKTPFFFKFSPWKQQRTGIDNTVVNPQTSKIARALVTSARWETEIALDNKELMDSFYLGVAEGLGVKTERQDNQLSVDAIIDTLATPIYADAVAAIRKRMIHKESLSDQEKDAVLLAVAKGGANLHSLDALIGMAYHAEAVATKVTTFVSRVYREVDGVANGTMLNHALLGAAENPEALAAILEHGGFFEEGSQYTHYSAYRGTQGNKDIYEKTGQMVYEEVTAAVGGMDSLVISSIWAIGGELFDPKTGIVSKAGRNLVKDGMNPLSFGSALESVVKGMADTFADSVYTGFEKLAAKQALPDEINDYVMSVNVLLDKKHHIPMNKPMQWHMENVFSNQARTSITNSFSSTVGQITYAVLEREFAVFLERRNALNGTAQTVFGMYDALYRGIREDYVNQLIASGDIVAEHGADRTADLSNEQEAELTKKLSFVAPVLRTAMSKNDRKGNGTRTGLLMAKSKRKMSNDPAYKNVSKFGTPFADRATSDTRYATARKTKSLTLRGFSKQYETIGVAIGSAATHSTDSRIMLMVQKMLDVLGIHDAAIDGVAGAKETANLLNSNTWESLLNYSPLEEVYLSTANMIQGMAQIIQNGDMPPQSITYLKEFLAKAQWKYGKGVNVLGAILNGAKQAAHQADTVKLGFMSTAGVIDQYAFQGGQYQVTQTNRDGAAQNLKELSDKIPKEISDALAVVQAALKAKPVVVPRPNSPVEEATAPTAETDEEGQFDVVGEQLDELPKGPATSPFGELGKSNNNNPELAAFFEENPKATAKQVMDLLETMLTRAASGGSHEFNLKLLERLRKSVNPKLTFNLITASTTMDDVLSKPDTDSFAWYSRDLSGTEAVYVTGPDFIGSAIRVEVLLHELVHAATSNLLDSNYGKPYRAELELLRQAAVKFVEEQKQLHPEKTAELDRFSSALSDVDEFVAYGMTRRPFQQLLAQVPTPGTKGMLTNALTKFVDTLTRLLGFTDTASAKALGSLISNVLSMMEGPNSTAQAPSTTGFSLNAGQQEAYQAVVDFLKSSTSSFSITGSAGTGKTTIVKTILDNLRKEGLGKYASNVVLTSPTHRANAVTRSKTTGQKVVTLHSLLGLAPEVNLEEFDARNVKFSKKSDTEGGSFPTGGLLIVDESSMINDALFKYLMDAADAAGTKVIFLGDMAQLGPVKQVTDSLALTSTGGQAALTQVMRAKNAALLDESIAVRENGDFTSQNNMDGAAGVSFTNDQGAFLEQAISLFKSAAFKANPLLVRVLAFRNNTVARYNARIREALHGKDANPYVPGELLMGYAAFGETNASTKLPQIANGVDYIVQSVGKEERRTFFGVGVMTIAVTVQDVYKLGAPSVIRIVSPNTSQETITDIGKAIANTIQQAKSDPRRWKFFYQEKQTLALPFDVMDASSGSNRTMVAKTVDYGYAHTIHKSQGGTYNFAMVDDKDINAARTEKDRSRLRYVGLTRAEQGTYVLTDTEITDTPSGVVTHAMAAPTNTYSTIDIHDALADGSLTNEFDEHLRSLLGGIVYNLHGAFGSFKKTLMKNQALDATDVWLKALNTGVAPFASEALGHIATTPQVAYALEQVDATIRAALETNESQTKMVYKELYKLYGEAESIVTVQSLIDAGLDAATAQATHDMLFKLEQGADNRSNYLARFAALGLAHPVINQVLQAATAKESRKARDGKTFMERLEIVFENIMKMFRTYVTHTYQGQPANDKLLSLVGQLVDIEAKYQRKIAAKANTSNVLEPIEAKLKVFVEATGAKIEAVADSNFIRNNRYTAVKVAGGLVGTVAGGRADLFMEGLFRLRAETFKKRFGVVASLAQAYVGQNVVFQGLLRMTKLLEHDRQKEVAGWATTALEAYADGGKMLRGKAKDNVAARASITSVFMRTGAHNLMGDFDMAGIEQLVTNKADLDTAIASFESKLAVHGRAAPYYVNQANALGYKLATGVARTKFVNQNAHAISRLSGTGQESKVSAAQAEQAETTLKVLVTLYALRYSDSTAVGHAARVIKAENARADMMNGLEMTLLLQKRLETESLERLFGNNPMLMIHGYTSEIYDPNVTIKTANVLEGKALLEQGYVKRAEVPRDPADDDQDVKHLYVLQDGGVPRFVSGAMSNRGMQAKGTTIHNGYTNAYNATGIANASQNATLMQDRRAAIADMFRPGPVKDLSKEKGSYLVPVFNENGVVTNWRYMMAETTKNNVLNRNNRFDKVLGTIAGSIYDKETSREQNMTVVKALHDQFKTDYQSNPKSYIHIGPKSEDPEMKEIWDLLPDDTRDDIREVWGHNGMTVKVENLDIVFGYRKLSVGTIFTKANEERDARKLAGQRTEVMALKTIDAWQKLIVMLFEFPLVGTGLKQGMTMEEAKKYARKAGANAVRTEHIWQAIVSEAKDIIVVKSGVVLLGNMSSNIWLLGMSGVPILDVMHHHLVAWKGAVSWKKDTVELEHLKRLRATGYTQGNKADIDRRILRLEDALDRNPVKELVEAGLMPTIVEDIDPEDDLYSYKSHLVRKVEGYTDKMNPTLVKAARTAYLAHDTPIYQAMSEMTRLSDFMARYTMYQHLISKKEPLSKQEATQKVSEAFINYDIALHRSIQYTDDMGITMFTKYFIGIQKVLLDTMRENPARVLTGVLLSKFLGLGPTVLDGSMWNHIGNNPLRSGPFELLGALDELPMINAPLALFNMGSSPAP